MISKRICVLVWFMFVFLSIQAQEQNKNIRNQTDTIGQSIDTLVASPHLPQLYLPESGMFGWQLHDGFNAQVSLSASFSFDKDAPSGVGFGKDIAVFYAKQLSKKWSVSGGLNLYDFSWGGYHERSLSLTGIVSYNVNDNIQLSAYAQKSLLPKSTINPMMRRNFSGDVIGASLDFKVNENVSFGVSFERREGMSPFPYPEYYR